MVHWGEEKKQRVSKLSWWQKHVNKRINKRENKNKNEKTTRE